LEKLLRAKSKAMHIQLSEAITGDGNRIFRHAGRFRASRASSRSAIGSRYVSGRTRAWLKTKNPNFERR